MQEKITRKELRQDDKFHSVLVNLSEKVRLHKQKIYLVTTGVVVIVVTSLVLISQKNKREGNAQAALATATQESNAQRSAFEAQALKKEGVKEGKGSGLTKEVVDKNEINRLEKVVAAYKGTKGAFQAELRVAQIYLDMKNYQEALKRFKDLADKADNPFLGSIVYYGLAYTEEELGNFEAASMAFDTVSRKAIPFFDSSALLGKARVLTELKRFDEAKKTYEEIIRRWPNSEVSKRSEQYISFLSLMNQ
ncbi:MAG: hypothetical protein A3F16_07105 [Deltaproteobacteria bacterium RIFCSPHIGHO2_12_FULL_43_9]|nr:MAG: hypothetical protein A3F16_07105 [Deltaproteobacteria bacterium RIFCSPHIGHO2_12_FULL_43_9]